MVALESHLGASPCHVSVHTPSNSSEPTSMQSVFTMRRRVTQYTLTVRLHQLHRFLSGIPPVSEAQHFLSRSLRRRSPRTRSRLYTCICEIMLPVAYWERDVRILSTSIQTCSMGTRCRNPEVDGRTTTICITAIIHTERFAVHNASVGLAQARPNDFACGSTLMAGRVPYYLNTAWKEC